MVARRLPIVFLISLLFAACASGQNRRPELVAIRSGDATLHAHVWRPAGNGPFPAVLINHGSGRTREDLKRLGPYEQQSETIGPVFIRHGYVCVFLFRRGVGPSTDQGENAIDAMNRVAIIGHSFGSSLSVLLTEREPTLRAAVVFSTAGYSWDQSPELRARLLEAARRTTVPLFFLHAENDYSTDSGKSLDAELGKRGKWHQLKIYPPVGRTPDDGHDFPLNSVATWEADVFAFLDSYVRK
jgi:carboxymethylenebutenolidase